MCIRWTGWVQGGGVEDAVADTQGAMHHSCLSEAPFMGPPLNPSLDPLLPLVWCVSAGVMGCDSFARARVRVCWGRGTCSVLSVGTGKLRSRHKLSVKAARLNARASILSTYKNRCGRLYSSYCQNKTAALAPVWTTCSVRAGTFAC